MKASKAPVAIATLLASALLLAACGKGQDPQPAAAAPAPDASAAAQPAAPATPAADTASAPITKDSPIWFEPASMSACPGTAPVVGVVHWNASSFPNVTTVQLTMPAGEGKPDGMFTVSANVGQKETGPWLAAGTEFVLRDNANGAELARAKMPAEPCAQQ